VVWACQDPTGLDSERRTATIAFFGLPIVFEAPDSVESGVAFTVTTRAYGNDCFRAGGEKIRRSDGVVELTPKVLVRTGPNVCDDILVTIDQDAEITLGSPGEYEIRIRGKELPVDSIVVASHTVVVR
jgi:hypothetical protein